MIEHTWIVEEVDGGSLGKGSFWKCSGCGASGGPISLKGAKRGKWIFLAGPALTLPEDCKEAQELILYYHYKIEQIRRDALYEAARAICYSCVDELPFLGSNWRSEPKRYMHNNGDGPYDCNADSIHQLINRELDD